MAESIFDKFDEAWLVDDLVIKINDQYYIEQSQLLSYEIMWYGPSMTGVISWVDQNDKGRTENIQVGGRIQISFTSQKDTKAGKPADWSMMFEIDKVSKNQAENNAVSEIWFSDKLSKLLQTGYAPRPYTTKDNGDPDKRKHSEIMEDVFRDYHLTDMQIKADQDEPAEIDFTIPGGPSIAVTLIKDWMYRGLTLVQDRFEGSTGLVHEKFLDDKLLEDTEEFFFWEPSQYYTRSQIIDFQIDGMNSTALMNTPRTQTSKINEEQLGTTEVETKIESEDEHTTDYKIPGTDTTVKDFSNFNGSAVSNEGIQGSKPSGKELRYLQTMSMWVPGINRNWMNMKISNEIPNPKNKMQNDMNTQYSGKWIVDKVRDKIINGYFIQQLFLRRAGL